MSSTSSISTSDLAALWGLLKTTALFAVAVDEACWPNNGAGAGAAFTIPPTPPAVVNKVVEVDRGSKANLQPPVCPFPKIRFIRTRGAAAVALVTAEYAPSSSANVLAESTATSPLLAAFPPNNARS